MDVVGGRLENSSSSCSSSIGWGWGMGKLNFCALGRAREGVCAGNNNSDVIAIRVSSADGSPGSGECRCTRISDSGTISGS